MSSASPSDVLIERRGGLIEAEVDGELVALHVENGTCYGFNGTATRIWSLLEEPMSLGQLCEALSLEFDTTENFETEVMDFVRDLEADGLVVVRAGTAAAATN